MSQTTPTIGLKTPEGTDPFLTDDFVQNWNKVDDAFAAVQADIAALETGGGDATTLDGNDSSYFYSPANPPPGGGGGGGSDSFQAYSWAGAGNLSVGLAANSLTSYQASKITLPASGSLSIWIYAEFGLPANAQQSFRLNALVDGSSADIASLGSQSLVPYAHTSGTWNVPVTHLALKTGLGAGNHLVTFTVQVGSGSSSYNTFRHWKAIMVYTTPGATYV